MDINKIIENAPDGAERYKIFSGIMAEYYRLIGESWHFYCLTSRNWVICELKNYEDAKVIPTRTKVGYVEVCQNHDWDAWEYLKEFSSGNCDWFYKVGNDKFAPVIEWFNVAECVRQGKRLYRRVETPITEREEFIEKVGDILPEFDKRTNPMWAGKLFDAGCRFAWE